MKITIEPSDPHGPMGQGYPRISVDTLIDGETIDQVFNAVRSAILAYGFSEESFNAEVSQYAAIIALPNGD